MLTPVRESHAQGHPIISNVTTSLSASENGENATHRRVLPYDKGKYLLLQFAQQGTLANTLALRLMDETNNTLWTISTDGIANNPSMLKLADGRVLLTFSYKDAMAVTLPDQTINLAKSEGTSWGDPIQSAVMIMMTPEGKYVMHKEFTAFNESSLGGGVSILPILLTEQQLLLNILAQCDYRLDGTAYECYRYNNSSWGMDMHQPITRLIAYNIQDGTFANYASITSIVKDSEQKDAESHSVVTSMLADGQGGAYIALEFSGSASFTFGKGSPIERSCMNPTTQEKRLLNGLLHLDAEGNCLKETYYEVVADYTNSNLPNMNIQQMATTSPQGELMVIGGGIGKLKLFNIAEPTANGTRDIISAGKEYDTDAGALFHYAARVNPTTMTIEQPIPLGILQHGKTSYNLLSSPLLAIHGNRAIVAAPFDKSMHAFGGTDPLMSLSEETDYGKSKRSNSLILMLDLSDAQSLRIVDGFAVQGKGVNSISSIIVDDAQHMRIFGDAQRGTDDLTINRGDQKDGIDPNRAVKINMQVELSNTTQQNVKVSVKILPGNKGLGYIMLDGSVKYEGKADTDPKHTVTVGSKVKIEAIARGEGRLVNLKVNGADFTSGHSFEVTDGISELAIEALFEADTTQEPPQTTTPVAADAWRDLKVTPNPCRDYLLVQHSQPIEGYRLYDLTGNTILHDDGSDSASLRIELPQALPQGVYILQLRTAQGTHSMRILRQKSQLPTR